MYFYHFFNIINVIGIILTFKYMVESPRWLLQNGRHNECVKNLNYIAKFNGVAFRDEPFFEILDTKIFLTKLELENYQAIQNKDLEGYY